MTVLGGEVLAFLFFPPRFLSGITVVTYVCGHSLCNLHKKCPKHQKRHMTLKLSVATPAEHRGEKSFFFVQCRAVKNF